MVVLVGHTSHGNVEHDSIPRLGVRQDVLRGGTPILPLHVFEVMLKVGRCALNGKDDKNQRYERHDPGGPNARDPVGREQNQRGQAQDKISRQKKWTSHGHSRYEEYWEK